MRYIDLGQAADQDGDVFPVIVPEKNIFRKGHTSLFSFLNADLASLGSAMESYFDSGFPSVDETDALFDRISSLHPWFSMNGANTSALMNRAAAAYACVRFPDSRASFLERFYVSRGVGSCSPGYWFGEDPFRYEPAPGEPVLDRPLLSIQQRLREMAVILLDHASPALSDASPRERLALYGLLHQDADYRGFVRAAGMSSSYGCAQTSPERRLGAVLDFSDEDEEISFERFCADVSRLSEDPSYPAPVIRGVLSGLGELGSRRAFDEILSPRSLFGLLSFEIFEMYQNGEHIRRGPDGMFPVPDTNDAPTEGTISEEEIRALYRKAYKTHFSRIRYGIMTKQEFSAWKKEAKEMFKKTVNGEISVGEFAMYLTN